MDEEEKRGKLKKERGRWRGDTGGAAATGAFAVNEALEEE